MIVTKRIITGCEDRGDGESPYLTRWSFPRLGPFRANVHLFHRSDGEEMHDHPWPFVSIVLWRGYVEETPATFGLMVARIWNPFYRGDVGANRRKRIWPGMIVYRPTEHVHRVELVRGRPAVTLFIMGERCREWGFHTAAGWEHFRSYFRRRGC